MHLRFTVVFGYSVPYLSIFHEDLTFSFRLVVHEVTSIYQFIICPQLSEPFSQTVDKISLKGSSIFPRIDSFPVGKIILEKSFKSVPVEITFPSVAKLPKTRKISPECSSCIYENIPVMVRVPFPSGFPYCQDPLKLSPLELIQRPTPCFFPSFHSPT